LYSLVAILRLSRYLFGTTEVWNMDFVLDLEQEEDGRWIAEISELPGVLAYGATPLQAGVKAKGLALRVLAERMESESSLPDISGITLESKVFGVTLRRAP
jgi:predicted RNase H-like HicB family nuclease